MKNKIDSLTPTRGIAAVLVVIHHYGRTAFPFNHTKQFFGNGNVSVSYFFVLSGFLLTWVYYGKQFTVGNFLKKRTAKIIPMYFFALLLVILLCLVNLSIDKGSHLPGNFWHQVLYSSLLIQAFVPDYALCLNGPGWSLSIEMFFYLLFPLLIFFLKKNQRVFLAATAILYVITQIIHMYTFRRLHEYSSPMQDVVLFNPVLHLNQFMIGMAGGYFFAKTEFMKHASILIPIGTLAIIMIAFAYKPQNISYQAGLLAPLFMILIICIASTNPAFLNTRLFVFSGQISYCVYILQNPIYRLFETLNPYLHLGRNVLFYTYLGALVLASVLCYNLIELPLHKKILSKK